MGAQVLDLIEPKLSKYPLKIPVVDLVGDVIGTPVEDFLSRGPELLVSQHLLVRVLFLVLKNVL